MLSRVLVRRSEVKIKDISAATFLCMILVGSVLTIPQANNFSPSDQASADRAVKIIEETEENETLPVEAPKWLRIDGLVQNVVNVTYAELSGFPMVSETTTLYCAAPWLNVTYTWTGVPLFFLLSLAKVVPGGYREVIFNATDNFSQSLPLEVIMEPTSLLALKANGTDLEQVEGFGNGYRVVFPCRWGYKWVKWVQYITIVDYVYRGDDLAPTNPRVNCAMPETDPRVSVFNVTTDTEYSILTMSNCTIQSMSYFSETRLVFNMTGLQSGTGYLYMVFPRELLNGPYAAYADQKRANYSDTYAGNSAYMFLTFAQSAGTVLVEVHRLISIENGGLWGETIRPLRSDA